MGKMGSCGVAVGVLYHSSLDLRKNKEEKEKGWVGDARGAEESKGDSRRMYLVGERERRPHRQRQRRRLFTDTVNARGGVGNSRGAEESKGDGRRVYVVGERVFKALRLLHHSTLCWRVMQKKKFIYRPNKSDG